ncbi:hypothetical protein [uncultured Desulfovibrio sp.]|uniref:hypothetical protein n=1 Tax=uncultured Desulfovibrio sp. TaxID=167968 RepID=UPI00261255F5|nr:hypothetical protein [uncultured Desulfovibrio sp.]
MVTPANATRLLCRAMFGVWLLAVCGMALVALGGGSSTGNLLALMFTRPVARTPVTPPPPQPLAQAEPTPEPAPAAATPEPQPVAEVSPWRDLPHGKRPGKGRLYPPRIEVRKDGSLLLLFAYEGTPGEHTVITPANVTSRSVDLHGQWSAQVTVNARPQNGCVQRLQIASHPSWIRVSAVSRGGKPLDADVSYSDKDIRIIFHPR